MVQFLIFFLFFGFLADTLFKDIAVLEHAHYLIINSNGMKKIKYWDVAKINISENLNFDDQVNEVDSLIEDIVKEQMVSDVPLGGFLSGGIDSSLIISKMSKINKNSVTTYTTGFNKKDINNDVIISDLKYARLLKNHFNDYNEILINPEKDMEKLIQKLNYNMDEPLTDPAAITTYQYVRHLKIN